MPEAVSPIKLSLAPMAAEIELQLFNEYMHPIAGRVIKKLYDYLASNTGTNGNGRELEGCIPIVGQAVQLFQAGAYPQAVDQAFAAYRYITVLRSHKPELPPVDLAS